MVRRILNISIVACLLLFALPLAAQDKENLDSRGDSLLAAYDYYGAAEIFEQAIKADSTDEQAYWKLASSLNQYAELQPREEQLAYFERAEKASERAIQLDSLDAEPHYQLARAVGKIALFKGVFKSAGLAKQVKKEAEMAIALDSTLDGAYHIMGRWHREVAQKPKFVRAPLGLGAADKRKGLEFFVKAIELKPGNVHHRLEYAISLLDLDYKKEARQQFEICVDLPAHGPLDFKYQKEAKEYLAKLDEKR